MKNIFLFYYILRTVFNNVLKHRENHITWEQMADPAEMMFVL